ncbi:LAMI_0H09032g1_1 [Lachancea mirantina]|uniref:LAMI_0H09032g1_1 n=1 Tax=Lachancea mirantina TaxID=1230905 RepID=A0A1G4KG37_9SACH|nr:LAMI_0H09032g1_1 [Lachancea mirantina]
MRLNDFTETQKTHHTVYPRFEKSQNDTDHLIPFQRLLNGNESQEMVHKRWELYNQVHSQYHLQVDEILRKIEINLHGEIGRVLTTTSETNNSNTFKCLFLLGSDSTTTINLPETDSTIKSALIDLTPKESPNIRMMLRRSMFKLLTAMEPAMASVEKEEMTEGDLDVMLEGSEPPESDVKGGLSLLGISYDLSLLENFYSIFRTKLKLILNFKDVDSFNFQVLDDFIVLLSSALRHDFIEICLVFNINTNVSNIEKNLKQSTIRLIKKSLKQLDLSRNKGFKYCNEVFLSFLNTVEGKLNLSPDFVKFILDKMSNNTTHNLQLLVKILDFSLMSYFFQNPFSVFIDPTNVIHFSESYVSPLLRCPTFMNFIDGLVGEHAPGEEIHSLLENKNSSLEEFFAEFLVRENPVNGHLRIVTNILENVVGISNYNLIELYYHLLIGSLSTYAKKWPACDKHAEFFNFEPVDIMFQELFTLTNSKELFTQSLFPLFRSNLEDNLINSERILPPSTEQRDEAMTRTESLDDLIDLPMCRLFNLYREGSALINVFDFYTAFRETLPQEELFERLAAIIDSHEINLSEELIEELQKMRGEGKEAFLDKVAVAWCLQTISEFQHIGILKFYNSKSYEALEKCIWRGL